MVQEKLTYYEILRVPRQTSPGEIKIAFRQLAKVYHPDATPGMSGSRFRQIYEAYKVLHDPAQRRAYDREIQARESTIALGYGSLTPCSELE